MADMACFVVRNTTSRAEEMTAPVNFKLAAQQLGHRMKYVYRQDIDRIPSFDALFICPLTDPLNATYVASRMAELHGMKVIDDPDSIICCDKINMFMHLLRAGIKIPETRFVEKKELDRRTMESLFEELGTPLILNAPHA